MVRQIEYRLFDWYEYVEIIGMEISIIKERESGGELAKSKKDKIC